MKKLLQALLPPLVLLLILSGIYLLPQQQELQESAISPKLPTGFELAGWYGQKMQESPKERSALPADTIFSKANYSTSISDAPPINVSIVYSGNDMNASIHRPERCLPAQGHFNLHSQASSITLSDGREVLFTRLESSTGLNGKLDKKVKHINYYVFVGKHSIRSTHMQRTLQDMSDRILGGYVQRWAYYQVGSYWGEDIGISEHVSDENLRALIQKLTPMIIDWEKID